MGEILNLQSSIYNFMTEQVEKSEFYFQSVGGLTGQYLPSSEDIAVGTLITSRGLFPANLVPYTKKFIENFPKATTKRFKYICWLKQWDTEPYYLFTLLKSPKKYPDWVIESGCFKLRGLIESVTAKEVVLLVQRNYKSRPTEEQIEQSISHIKIDNCPKGIRKGQFWQIDAMLEEGKLNHLTSHRIADARQTKKLLAEQKEMFLQSRGLVKSV